MEFSKQVTMDNSSVKSNTANTVENTLTPEEQQKAQQELSQLSNIIKEWKQTAEEVKILNEAMRE